LNRIEDYDSTLLEDIQRLENHVSKAEELAKEYMRVYGTPEKTIDEVASKAWDEDRPISIDGSGSSVFRLLKFLKDMAPVYTDFPFRLRMGDYFVTGLGTEVCVVTRDDEFVFNTRPLNDEERKEYLNHWNATQQLNYAGREGSVYRWYPTAELVKFIAKMMTKYNAGDVLTKNVYHDEKLGALWEKEWSTLREKLRAYKVTRSNQQKMVAAPTIRRRTHPSQQRHGNVRGLIRAKVAGVSIRWWLAFLAFWVAVYQLYHHVLRNW